MAQLRTGALNEQCALFVVCFISTGSVLLHLIIELSELRYLLSFLSTHQTKVKEEKP